MSEHLEAILTQATKRGAQQAEVYSVCTDETPVRFEANKLKELNRRETTGVALRVIAGGRVGFASSTRPGDTDALVEAALETAPFGPAAAFDFPSDSDAPLVDVYDVSAGELSVDTMVELGRELVSRVRDTEPELQCDASVRRATGTVTILNSSGGQFSYSASSVVAWLHGTLIRGTDMLFVGDATASCGADIDLGGVYDEIALQLERSRRNAEVSTGNLPVVFTPLGVAEALTGPLLMAFNGRLVHQGQSPLAGTSGQKKYDERLSIYDDGTLPGRVGSRPTDDEGVASRRIPLIENGVVGMFMYDLQAAGQASSASTGSARRALTSQPTIGSTNVLIEPGETSFDDMVRGIKEGIIVEELMGAGQGNVAGGDFSGNVLLGYKIENGDIVGRVKNTIVAGNVHEALARVAAVGSEQRWVGGTMLTPALMVEGLAVSSTGS